MAAQRTLGIERGGRAAGGLVEAGVKQRGGASGGIRRVRHLLVGADLELIYVGLHERTSGGPEQQDPAQPAATLRI